MLACWPGLGRLRPAALLALTATLPACGGGSSPSGPSPPTTQPVARAPLTAVVFYDEDADGQIGAGEVVRLPGVEVVVGDASARTGTGGRAVVQAPLGAQTVALRTETVPVYYVPPSPIAVSVPTSTEVVVPVRLPLGNVRPNVYMAFGDSITVGEGSSDGTGYRARLDQRLSAHLGTSEVANAGRDGTQTDEGADRVGRNLGIFRPAYTLVLYGTNDWNTPQCQAGPPCDTINEMRDLLRQVQAFGSLPVLSTIIPVNPNLQPPQRNDWVRAQNDNLRQLARELGVPVADPARLFFNASNLPSLFADAVHPNDQGYELIATAFFEALTGPRSASAASFGFARP